MTGPAPTLNPTALDPNDLARLLSAAGARAVTVEMLNADIAVGAPTNSGGTLNVVHYGAWLLRGLERGFEVSGRLGEEADTPGVGQMTFDWSEAGDKHEKRGPTPADTGPAP